jgi:hypothetical protein
MIEMLQAFFACIGAALFFVSILIAVRSFLLGPASAQAEDEDSGAPEGDQIHFRIGEVVNARRDEATPSVTTRRR